MSYTTPMLVQKNGEILELDDLRNSHGWGPFVWSAVSAKYLGHFSPRYPESAWLVSDEARAALWPLWKDTRLPRPWRAALLATYDFAIVERERAKEIAGLLREFVTSVGVRDRACHLLTVADLLEQYAADESVVGMCFKGSLSEDPWHPWDAEKDERTTYDLKASDRHFFVGASLDESDRLALSSQQPAPSDT
jgi:hypothetical protein